MLLLKFSTIFHPAYVNDLLISSLIIFSFLANIPLLLEKLFRNTNRVELGVKELTLRKSCVSKVGHSLWYVL